MNEAQAAAIAMRSTAEEILSQVDSMPKECIYWKPGPEVWTVMDNLCHVIEFVPYWTAQAEQAIEHPAQEWGRTHNDPNRLVAVTGASFRDLTGVKEQLRSCVMASASTLEKLTPEQLATQAPSRNPKWGIKPASFIVNTLLVDHLRSHLSQIRRNLTQYQEQLHTGHPEGKLS